MQIAQDRIQCFSNARGKAPAPIKYKLGRADIFREPKKIKTGSRVCSVYISSIT